MIGTLWSLLSASARRRFLGYAVLVTLGIVLRAVGTVLLVPLLSALFGATPSDAWPWVGALSAVTVAGWFVDGYAARIGFELGFGVLDEAQHDVADRLSRIRLDWFSSETTPTARQAIAATGPDLIGLIVYLLTPLAGAIALPVAISLALLAISWPLGLAALAGYPLLLGAYWAGTAITRSADAFAAQTNSRLTERILEFARTQQALRAARRAEPARSQAGEALAAQHGAGQRLLLLQIPGELLFSVASQLALVLLAGTAALLTVRGELSAPGAVAMIVVIVRFLEPFTTLGQLAGGVEGARRTLRRIQEVLAAPITSSGTASYSPVRAPEIELRDVDFSYGDGDLVLSKLSVQLAAGTTTAIVGPSGSGKSTVLALLAGLYQPTGGGVFVDGHDTATLDSPSSDALRSVVFQQPVLFDGTIEENVRAGDPAASAERLGEVLRLARVDEFAGRLPGGTDSLVGEGGVALSGGERQRVSIARALLKAAPVLLVDEATSALDNENERAVAAALTSDPTPRTRVVVAHRLSSIRAADRVLFLQDGQIIEDGTIEALRAAGGRFAQFWREQASTDRWRLGRDSEDGPAQPPGAAAEARTS